MRLSTPVKIISGMAVLIAVFYSVRRLLPREAPTGQRIITASVPNEKNNAPELVQIAPATESKRFDSVVDEAIKINKNIIANPVESVKELGNAVKEFFMPTREFHASPSPPTRRAAGAVKIKSAVPNFTRQFTSAYDSMIREAATAAGIDEKIFKQLLIQESGLDPAATNERSGAQGIAQFMPATWKEWGSGSPLVAANAIPASARYVKWLLDQTGNYPDALAAYNWGIGNLKRKGWKAAPRETREYVAKITKRAGYESI